MLKSEAILKPVDIPVRLTGMVTTVRLPDLLKTRASAYADELGISLNALVAVALKDYLDSRASGVVGSGKLETGSLGSPRIDATVPGEPRVPSVLEGEQVTVLSRQELRALQRKQAKRLIPGSGGDKGQK